MTREYGVVEVIHKPTGEKRLIKWDRFNPEIHKQIGDIHSKEHAMYYDKPVHLQSDAVGMAVVAGQVKAEELEAAQAEAKQDMNTAEVAPESTPVEAESVEVEEEKPDNVFDASVELPIEEVEKLKMFQLRQYVKHRGIEVTPKSTKIDLLAQVRSLK